MFEKNLKIEKKNIFLTKNLSATEVTPRTVIQKRIANCNCSLQLTTQRHLGMVKCEDRKVNLLLVLKKAFKRNPLCSFFTEQRERNKARDPREGEASKEKKKNGTKTTAERERENEEEEKLEVLLPIRSRARG